MSVPLYLCLHLRDFAAQTIARLEPELGKRPLAILDGDPPLETVFALNQSARNLGLESGMSRLQAESFEGISVSARVKQREDSAFRIFMKSAARFSPRIEVLTSPTERTSGASLILDASGSERLFGAPAQIAAALRREVDAAGFEPSIATSCNAYAAVLAARGIPGITVIPPQSESTILFTLPLSVLELEPEQEETFASWGINTLGALGALPQKALIARIGQAGYRLQALGARRISTSACASCTARRCRSERKHRAGTSSRSAGATAICTQQDAGADHCAAAERAWPSPAWKQGSYWIVRHGKNIVE